MVFLFICSLLVVHFLSVFVVDRVMMEATPWFVSILEVDFQYYKYLTKYDVRWETSNAVALVVTFFLFCVIPLMSLLIQVILYRFVDSSRFVHFIIAHYLIRIFFDTSNEHAERIKLRATRNGYTLGVSLLCFLVLRFEMMHMVLVDLLNVDEGVFLLRLFEIKKRLLNDEIFPPFTDVLVFVKAKGPMIHLARVGLKALVLFHLIVSKTQFKPLDMFAMYFILYQVANDYWELSKRKRE